MYIVCTTHLIYLTKYSLRLFKNNSFNSTAIQRGSV